MQRVAFPLLCVFAVCLSGCAKLDHNYRPVEPGALYRSGQIPHTRLPYFLKKNNIALVVNLRGADTEEAWYEKEVAVCEAMDVPHESLDWSMAKIPEPESLARLLRSYEETEGAILVHCHGGVHRAGIASSSYVLLNGGSVHDARKQIGFWFMGAPIGELLDLYEGSDLPFKQWVEEVYPGLFAERQAR